MNFEIKIDIFTKRIWIFESEDLGLNGGWYKKGLDFT